MIKAIVFDCFGVLASDGWLPFRTRHFGENAELLEEATSLNKQVDAGLADYDDFIHAVAALADVTEATARQEIESNVPDAQLFEYIRPLKAEYKIGMLSNAGANWLDKMFTPNQTALFDAVVLSYELGIVKPDARMYEAIASRLGVLPEECVFIDDQPRYLIGAQDIGMQTVLYENFEQFKTALEKLLN